MSFNRTEQTKHVQLQVDNDDDDDDDDGEGGGDDLEENGVEDKIILK
jgi:hypothetical protein